MSYVWFCTTAKKSGVQSPLQAKLLAILYKLEIAIKRNIHSILAESDSLLALSEILKNLSSLCEWGSIISNIWNTIIDCDICLFRHMRKGANSFAHNVTKLSRKVDESRFWYRKLPHLFVILIILRLNDDTR